MSTTKELRQSEDPQAFFEKYGFTMSMTKDHPTHKALMSFEGLEADYVSRLEREVSDLHKFITQLHEKMDWLRDREFAKFKRGES